MNSQVVDLKKRRMLIAATAGVGAIGTGFVAVPFLSYWAPSARAKAMGAPETVEFSKLEPGAMMTAKWRGKVCWIVRRTEATLKTLQENIAHLADPDSEVPQQPDYCKNYYRSIKPEYLVAIGICTHLGCSPTYRPQLAPADLGEKWKGGFFCACHGSRFDMAARVYAGVPAPTNLVIPKHKYLSATKIVIGLDDEGGAA